MGGVVGGDGVCVVLVFGGVFSLVGLEGDEAVGENLAVLLLLFLLVVVPILPKVLAMGELGLF